MHVERCVSIHSFERRSRVVDDVTDDDEVGNEMRRNAVNWNSMRRILSCYLECGVAACVCLCSTLLRVYARIFAVARIFFIQNYDEFSKLKRSISYLIANKIFSFYLLFHSNPLKVMNCNDIQYIII